MAVLVGLDRRQPRRIALPNNPTYDGGQDDDGEGGETRRFIAIADDVRLHPLRPLDGRVALDDTDARVFARTGTAPNTFDTLSHPPLVPYLARSCASPKLARVGASCQAGTERDGQRSPSRRGLPRPFIKRLSVHAGRSV